MASSELLIDEKTHNAIYGMFSKVQKISDNPNKVFTKFNSLRHLDDVSKKLPIVAENNIFFEGKNEGELTPISRWHHSGSTELSGGTTYIQTRDIHALKNWLSTSKKLIDSNRILYLPKLVQKYYETIEVSPLNYKSKEGTQDFLIPNRFFNALPEAELEVSDSNLIPIYSLEIPGLERITPNKLAVLMDDYPEYLQTFRNHLQLKLLEVKSNFDSEDFYKSVKKIEIELFDELNSLKNNFEILKKKSIIEAIGAHGITWSIYVFLFFNSPNELLKILLPGGMVSAVSSTVAQYIKGMNDVKNSPVYFLLLISKDIK